jgi:hypothetical protein
VAGTLRGSIEHLITNRAAEATRDTWTYVYNFLTNHPNVDLIASQYGNGASGFDLSDGSNPSGENAFAVFKFSSAANPWYVLIQWSHSASIGTSPGNPGSGAGTYGLHVSFAAGSGGGNPWNGGTDKDGADAKGATVWVPPASEDLLVWPRGNASGGSWATNRERMSSAAYYANGRLQILADDDFLFIAYDAGNTSDKIQGTSGYDRIMYFGPYDPYVTVSVPLVMIQGNLEAAELVVGSSGGVEYGSATGAGTTTRDGGIVSTSTSVGVRVGYLDRLQNIMTGGTQPGLEGRFSIYPIIVQTNDSEGSGTTGVLGEINLIKEVCWVPTHFSTPNLQEIAIGSTDIEDIKLLVPWDGNTVPGTGKNPGGVQFP